MSFSLKSLIPFFILMIVSLTAIVYVFGGAFRTLFYDPTHFGSQDLPDGATNGEWLSLTHFTGERCVNSLAETATIIRVRVLDERVEPFEELHRDSYYKHLFSIYRAEILGIYSGRHLLLQETLDVGDVFEFLQINRIVGHSRIAWFSDNRAENVENPMILRRYTRLPIYEGDELVLILSFFNKSHLRPFHLLDAFIEGFRVVRCEDIYFESLFDFSELEFSMQDLLGLSR